MINYYKNNIIILTITMPSTKINNVRFNGYVQKFDDFEMVYKIPRDMKEMHDKIISMDKVKYSRNKDSRLSFKNRRNINKDWKDFNNSFDE